MTAANGRLQTFPIPALKWPKDLKGKMRSLTTSRTLSRTLFLLLLLCGDVESNPGPPRRSLATGTAPSADEKIESLTNTLSEYEAKVSGLETEIDAQKKTYESRLGTLEAKLEALLGEVAEIKSDGGDVVKDMKESMQRRLDEAEAKVAETEKAFETLTCCNDAQTLETNRKMEAVEETVRELRANSDGSIGDIARDGQQLRVSQNE